MTLSATKAPVGPVDVLALINKIKNGEGVPQTASVQICVNPQAAKDADAVLDEIEDLRIRIDREAGDERSIGESAEQYIAEMEALEAKHDAIYAEYELSLITFKFRGQGLGDRAQVEFAMKRDGIDQNDPEQAAPYGTAQYMIEPATMTVDEVKRMIPVIGWPQFSKMVECWQSLVFLEPSAPLSLRPSRIQGTEKS